MEKFTIKGLWQVFKQAASNFISDKVTKLSASLAYYTLFSLAPMLIVVIYLSNLLYREEAIEGSLYNQMKGFVGDNAALQIQEIIKNASYSGSNTLHAIIGFTTLLIGATTIFAEIQDSINTIWRLRPKVNGGWQIMLKKRLLSFSMLVSLAFLLLVSLLINGLVEGLMDKLQRYFPQATILLVYVVNLAITLLVTSSLFAIIFKVLPDALIRWRDVFAGAMFTALLFMLGRIAISVYISNTNPASAYGTAGSLVILLLWIYYSSIILYFGAEFTKCYTLKFGHEIRPKSYAVIVQTVQVESHNKSLQQDEKEAASLEKELQKAKDDMENDNQPADK